MISAIVLTKNEEKDIARCLQSLSWCQERIVIDDYSEDQTVKLARLNRAKVFQRNLNNDFSEQRNFGLKLAKGAWILFVDADEVITAELKEEICQAIAKKNNINGYFFKRKDKFLGKWLKFGETANIRLLRLARKGTGLWQNRVHEIWQIKGNTDIFVNPLIHQRQISVSELLTRINNYSSIRAYELYQKKVKANWFAICAYPLGKFVQNYIWRLGFLDGKAGLIMAMMMSLHSFFVRSKLFLLWQNRGEEEFKIPPLKTLYKKYG